MDFLEKDILECKIYFKVKDNEVIYLEDNNVDSDYITVFFRKPNWYYDSDIIRQSLVTAHDNAYAKEIDSAKYYDTELKTVLLYINFGEEILKVDNKLIDELDSKLCDVISKKYQKIKKNYRRNCVSKQYELKLCRDIYNYLKFYNVDIKSGNVSEVQEPPRMPAILAVIQLAEKFHWTFDYIINLPEDIISSLLTAIQQRDEFWEKYPTMFAGSCKQEEQKPGKNLVLNKEDFMRMRQNFLEKKKEQKRGKPK